MTPQEYKRRVAEVRKRLHEERPAETLRVANELLTQVKERIIGSGRNYQGNPFASYNPIYAKRRDEAGRQTQYVDFEFTGRMWASIRPEVTLNTPTTTEVTIKASNQGDQDKLNGQFRKRGNILRPTEQEIEFARQANADRIRELIQRI